MLYWIPLFACTPDKSSVPNDKADTGSIEDTGETEYTDTAMTNDVLSDAYTIGSDTVWVEAIETDSLRQYTMTTTHPLRDGYPQTRTFSETPSDPRLRSGELLTDALFAMAVFEAKENSVSEISDGAFSESVACECYQTGELWNWVWTRDIGYAVDLGLKHLDPERSWNSLWCKTAERKDGGGREIIQDTGTAGSWPVSSDRVVWTRGAMSIWRQTRDPNMKSQLIDVLRHTVETDRAYVLDPVDGLYRGETSFLDWREQTYPQWMVDTPSHIAMSKSLSTNLSHLYTLRALEELTEDDWGSTELATAIDEAFWTGTAYSSFIATDLFPYPVHQQDLLATSLAILDLGTHPEALHQYPHTEFGAPVIHPQQQRTPIYHNRANWPFVSAYALLAAKQSDNNAVFNAQLDALVNGAALNLSHMENWEIQTGENWHDDGVFSGPVINSRRQLWSVAGFIGVIVDGVFGLSYDHNTQTWNSNPTLPNHWFSDEATLYIHNQEFQLGSNRLSEGHITWLDTSDWRNIYAPQPPTLQIINSDDGIILDPTPLEDGVGFTIYKEGVPLQSQTNVPSDTPNPLTTSCYTVTTHFEGLSNTSHPADPVCVWGDSYAHINSLFVEDLTINGGTYSTTHGRPHHDNWGEPEHSIQGEVFISESGRHLLQVVYGNGAGGLDSGITAAVKWARVYDSNGVTLAEGPLVMPQLGSWDEWRESSFLSFQAQAFQVVFFEITDGLNMSYFEHYRTYNGNGGGEAPYNFVNISEVKVLYRGP